MMAVFDDLPMMIILVQTLPVREKWVGFAKFQVPLLAEQCLGLIPQAG